MTVSGTSEGTGTQDTPYIGQSNFNTVKTTTESVETTVPCTVEVDGMTLNVYKVNDQEGKYVGIGEKKEDDGSVSTVYYAVTTDGETYTADSKLTMNTTYQWKNGETAVTVPSTITPETVVIDKNENENAKAKAFTLDSATNAPTDAEYDESKYRNGEQYLIHGMDTVTENGTPLDVKQVWSKKDPLHSISYDIPRGAANNGTLTFPSTSCMHMFEVTASSASSTLEISVTDRFGNVSTESMTRPKALTTDVTK